MSNDHKTTADRLFFTVLSHLSKSEVSKFIDDPDNNGGTRSTDRGMALYDEIKDDIKDRKMKIPPLSQTREQITQGHVDNAVNYVLSRVDEEAEDALSSVTGLIGELRADRQALFADRNNLSDALLEVIRISVEPTMRADRLERIRQCAGSALDRSNGVAKQQVEALK